MFRHIINKIKEGSCISLNNLFSKKTKNVSTTNDSMSSLLNTKWNCKYHIIFTPKYRRKFFIGKKRMRGKFEV